MTPYSLVRGTNIFKEHIASNFGVDVNQIGKMAVFIKEVGKKWIPEDRSGHRKLELGKRRWFNGNCRL
jgi:hypothetical protein